MEQYSAIRKGEILPIATTWIDFENIILSEVSQMKMTKPNDFTYMWAIKQRATKETKQTNSQTQIRVPYKGTLIRWEGGWGKMKRIKGIKYLVMKRDQTLGSEHTMQHRDEVSQNYTPETYILLLTNITPINLNKK